MIDKQVLPESFDFGVPSVELVEAGRKGLDKTAMVKRASAFEDILEDLKPKPNRTYLHVITTGGGEWYGPNLNCFVAGTPVITDQGTLPIEDIQCGMRVKTHTGQFCPVLKTMAREYTGELCKIKVQGIPEAVTMTADHPVAAVQHKIWHRSWSNDYYGRSIRSLPDMLDAFENEPSYVNAGSLECADMVFIPELDTDADILDIEQGIRVTKKYKEWNFDPEDLVQAYCMGLWLAEGCTYRKCATRNSVNGHSKQGLVWVLSRDKDTESFEVLINMIRRAGFSPWCQYIKNAVHITWNTSKAAEFYTQLMGSGAKHKRLHPAIFNMSDSWKLAFLGGYLDGDGHIMPNGKESGRISASTASISLAHDIQQLLQGLGIKSSISKCWNRECNGCLGKGDNPIYSITVATGLTAPLFAYTRRIRPIDNMRAITISNSKNYINKSTLWCRITHIEHYRPEHPVTVYNLEVEDAHTFCVPFVVHNCDFYNEDSFKVKFPHPEDPKHTEEVLDGGLTKYHDDEYMKNGAVYQEHKTKKHGVEPSGEIVSARYNKPMHRGELIIAVDTEKWAPRLERKAKGQDLYLSIGCSIDHDTCNVCGHHAKTMDKHCDHFKKMRNMVLEDGTRCYVINDAPKFYDISGVDVPADRIAFVLNKVASGASVKEASVQALMSLGYRKPMLFTKAATILDKLSRMEKKITAMVDDGNAEAYMDDIKVEKDFPPVVENWDADEVIDSCSRKGILLSPGLLFKILGKECEDPEDQAILCSCDDGCCGDCSTIIEDLDNDEDRNDILMDGSFDAKFPVDLTLDRILEDFVPELGCSDPAVNAKIIRITVTGREPKPQTKEAKFNKTASQALRNVYARYLISFAERNDDATCWNALRKCAHFGK